MKIQEIKKQLAQEIKKQVLKSLQEAADSERSIVSPFPTQDSSPQDYEKSKPETPSSKKGTEQFQQRMLSRDKMISEEHAKLAMQKVSEQLGKSIMDMKDNENFRQFVIERVKANAKKMDIQPTMQDIIDQTVMSVNSLLFSVLRENLQPELERVIDKALKSK